MEYVDIDRIDHVIQGYNINDTFLKLAEHILRKGKRVSPRGMSTLEISPLMTIIEHPSSNVMLFKERKLNRISSAMELCWILSGDEDPWIIDYMKTLSNYTDEFEGKNYLMGAYGPRIRKYTSVDPITKNVNTIDQLKYVVDKLTLDKDSRQAVIVIWNPTADTEKNKDIPCTNLMKFSIRDDSLNMTVFMRSNDLYRGSSYDFFNFTSIQCLLAGILNVKVGTYYHIADSHHIYESDIPKIENILKNSDTVKTDFPLISESESYKSIDELDNDLKNRIVPLTNNKYISNLYRWVNDNKKKNML